MGLVAVLIGGPLYLTGVNLYNTFVKKRFSSGVIDILILTLGPLLSWWLFTLWYPFGDEIETLIFFPQPIFNYPIFIVFAFIAIAGYAVLRIKKTSLPRTAITICLGALFIGCTLSMIWTIQFISSHFIDLFYVMVGGLLCLFPFNYVILTISLVRRIKDETRVSCEETRNSTTDSA